MSEQFKQMESYCTLFGWTYEEADKAKAYGIMFGLILGLAIFGGIMEWLSYWAWGIVQAQAASEVRHKYFQAMLRQDMAWHDRHNSGALNTAITAGSDTIAGGVS